MPNQVPIVRKVAWIFVLPHVTVLLFSFWLFSCFVPAPPSIFYAVGAYFLLSFGLRFWPTRNHRKGMTLLRNQDYAQAIPFFEQSVTYFQRHAWMDNYRYITLLASSQMKYREMALCNIAFCYSQMDQAGKAKSMYERILAEFPQNSIAITALEQYNQESRDPV